MTRMYKLRVNNRELVKIVYIVLYSFYEKKIFIFFYFTENPLRDF